MRWPNTVACKMRRCAETLQLLQAAADCQDCPAGTFGSTPGQSLCEAKVLADVMFKRMEGSGHYKPFRSSMSDPWELAAARQKARNFEFGLLVESCGLMQEDAFLVSTLLFRHWPLSKTHSVGPHRVVAGMCAWLGVPSRWPQPVRGMSCRGSWNLFEFSYVE